MQVHIRRSSMLVLVALVLLLMVAGISQAATTKSRVKSDKPHAKITAKQAEAIALKKFPGKIVGKTKLENEEGVWQYGVMVRSDKTLREVMVNAKTGMIDNVEVTTSGKEKSEAANENGKPEKHAGKVGSRTK